MLLFSFWTLQLKGHQCFTSTAYYLMFIAFCICGFKVSQTHYVLYRSLWSRIWLIIYYRIDAATSIPSRLGGLVNDQEENSSLCNCKMKLIVCNKQPRLCLFAKRNIAKNEELRYDYGDEESKLLWRNKVLFLVNLIKGFVIHNEVFNLFWYQVIKFNEFEISSISLIRP